MCATECGIYSNGADKYKVRRPRPLLPSTPARPLLPSHRQPARPPPPQGDSLCRRNEPEYRAGTPVYLCRPPTTYPAPHCDSGYSLCQTQGKTTQTVRACEEKRACRRKINKCAKKVRKKPWKRYKCLKKWGTNADGSCTHLKTQRKCPTSCGVCD